MEAWPAKEPHLHQVNKGLLYRHAVTNISFFTDFNRVCHSDYGIVSLLDLIMVLKTLGHAHWYVEYESILGFIVQILTSHSKVNISTLKPWPRWHTKPEGTHFSSPPGHSMFSEA